MAPSRFDRLPRRRVGDREVPVATGFRARALGLSLLDREDAGPGLLIPRCASVHTFGMRFALDVHFLDADGAVLGSRLAVPPRRFVAQRGAAAVLEVPNPGP
ncbi:MAG TPA: DUF192 domain-containing protein [Solirubrobacterales bacterium]|jgi:uncharacterized membrane protein (UPF0127 family)|nr:DUF192 domain-containing protein [Solirubrobacterales bacterium]